MTRRTELEPISMTPIGSRSDGGRSFSTKRSRLVNRGPCSVFAKRTEAWREILLQRLPATRKAWVRQEVLVRVEGILPFRRRDPLRGAVRLYPPALLVVFEVGDHDLVQDLLVHRGVENRDHGFDTTIEIAWHHVRGADVDGGLRRWQPLAAPKTVNARVLEEAADDALDANIIGKARNFRLEAAHTPHHEVDADPGLACLVKGVDDLRVDERVHLHPDGGRAPGLGVLDLLADVRDDSPADAVRARR